MPVTRAVHAHITSKSGASTVHAALVQVGTIVDEINQKLLSVRMGEFSIAEKGHTVILNWNRHVPPILRQVNKISIYTGHQLSVFKHGSG